jgi:hypothetical protein
MWLGNFDALGAPVHDGTQEAPHKPVVADWLYFPHPTCRHGVLLRFSRKVPAALHLPPSIPQADGQAAIEFLVRSGDEVSLSFATPEELPRRKRPTGGP